MYESTVITFAGHLAEDPELRFTPDGGKAVCTMRVMCNRRVRDAAGNYKDGIPTVLDLKVWGQEGENAAESYTRGSRVVGYGVLETETWKDRQSGEDRYRQVIVNPEIGGSTKKATLQITTNVKTAPAGG